MKHFTMLQKRIWFSGSH